jgi:hypothetical protein
VTLTLGSCWLSWASTSLVMSSAGRGQRRSPIDRDVGAARVITVLMIGPSRVPICWLTCAWVDWRFCCARCQLLLALRCCVWKRGDALLQRGVGLAAVERVHRRLDRLALGLELLLQRLGALLEAYC